MESIILIVAFGRVWLPPSEHIRRLGLNSCGVLCNLRRLVVLIASGDWLRRAAGSGAWCRHWPTVGSRGPNSWLATSERLPRHLRKSQNALPCRLATEWKYKVANLEGSVWWTERRLAQLLFFCNVFTPIKMRKTKRNLNSQGYVTFSRLILSDGFASSNFIPYSKSQARKWFGADCAALRRCNIPLTLRGLKLKRTNQSLKKVFNLCAKACERTLYADPIQSYKPDWG